jgi:hypothetical protein
MGPLQSSKTGPSEATTSAGGGADLFRPVIRLQKQLLDELQHPAAKLTLIRLKETSRMKDIGVPLFAARTCSVDDLPFTGESCAGDSSCQTRL